MITKGTCPAETMDRSDLAESIKQPCSWEGDLGSICNRGIAYLGYRKQVRFVLSAELIETWSLNLPAERAITKGTCPTEMMDKLDLVELIKQYCSWEDDHRRICNRGMAGRGDRKQGRLYYQLSWLKHNLKTSQLRGQSPKEPVQLRWWID